MSKASRQCHDCRTTFSDRKKSTSISAVEKAYAIYSQINAGKVKLCGRIMQCWLTASQRDQRHMGGYARRVQAVTTTRPI